MNSLSLIQKTSPIQRIPPEILLVIFIACLPENKYRRPSISEAPMLLSHVCSTWRALATETSRLWSSLGIDILEQGSTQLPLVELWLSRLRDTPFDFAFRLDQWSPVHLPLAKHAESTLGLLASKISYWRDVQLALPGSYRFLQSIPADTPANHLCSLTVDLQDWKEDELDDLNRMFQSARSLRRLTWNNRASWSSWDRSFDDILCKMDISWGCLTHIVFDAWICLADLLFILNQCSNLVECDLRHFGGGSLTDSFSKNVCNTRLVLPHLQFLSIYQLYLNTGLGSLLDSIQCPSLQDFTAICGFIDSVTWPQHQFLTFLEQSSCALSSLSLEYTGITEDELIECLSITSQSLTQLRVSDGRGKLVVSEKLLYALTHKQDTLLLCPELEAVHLETPISAPEGMIADMVMSRRSGHLSKLMRRLGFTASRNPARKLDVERLKELIKAGLELCIM